MDLRDLGLGIEQPKNLEIDLRWHVRKEGGSRRCPLLTGLSNKEQLQWEY